METHQLSEQVKRNAMTNTDRLVCDLEAAEQVHGSSATIHFNVGKFTGNSPVVIAALRRRGLTVQRDVGAWVLTR